MMANTPLTQCQRQSTRFFSAPLLTSSVKATRTSVVCFCDSNLAKITINQGGAL